MANILNITGLSTSTGRQRLIAVFGNDYHIYSSTTDAWTGQSIPVTTNQSIIRSTIFLNRAFFVNGYKTISADTYTKGDDPKSYNGSTWRNEYVVKKLPLSLYVRAVGERIYLANCYLKAIDDVNPSMVWFSDLPQNNDLTYGFEEGTVISGLINQKQVSVSTGNNIYFKMRNIKVGDPIYFPSVSGKTRYFVSSIDSEEKLTLTENLEATLTNEKFWVGSNFFFVSRNDGDSITGLGDNNDNLLVFKRNSLWRYNTVSLKKIKGVPGTTSQDSVVNIKDFTYYFHETGIWRTNGVTAELISRPIQDYIEGISSDMYSQVVAWRTGPSLETLRVYVGNVSNTDTNLTVNKCILDFDTAIESWSPGQLNIAVTATTEFLESATRNVYIANSNGQVYQDNKGTDDDGTAISWMMDTGFHFPLGPTVELEFEKIQIHVKNGRGLSMKYKLYGTPFSVDKQWRGDLDDVSDEITEVYFKGRVESPNIGRGIAFQISDADGYKTPTVERIDIFYKPVTSRSL